MPATLFRFTKENAREFSAKGNAAKAARLQELRDAIQTATLDPDIDYGNRRLARVRLQLDRLDEMAMRESDAQKLDRLASAQSRLSETERQLSGRSMPPTVRAREARPDKRRSSTYEPEAQVAPAVQAPVIPPAEIQPTIPSDQEPNG